MKKLKMNEHWNNFFKRMNDYNEMVLNNWNKWTCFKNNKWMNEQKFWMND